MSQALKKIKFNRMPVQQFFLRILLQITNIKSQYSTYTNAESIILDITALHITMD